MEPEKMDPNVGATESDLDSKVVLPQSAYSIWRRGFGKPFYAYDVDFVEQRPNKGIVGLIAVTAVQTPDDLDSVPLREHIWRRTYWERKIMITISEAIRKPAFYVIHTEDVKLFHVFCSLHASAPGEPCVMGEPEYKSFVQGLGG